MKYRILVTKTLDVPKNLLTAVCDSEQEAIKEAKDKLGELDGDVAIVAKIIGGNQKVIHTFEKVRKAG
ncbi:MAG: hypothetical protein HY562_11020 [Ignavibacteriales bacterium]|nr:hypothetical protein [Ignavibacteriales bacterium]